MNSTTMEETKPTGGRKADIIVAAVILLVVVAGAAWFLLGDLGSSVEDDSFTAARPTESTRAEPEVLSVAAEQSESVQTLLNKARMALNADMVAEPPGQNALYFYSLAVEADPDSTEARDEFNSVSDQVSQLIRDFLAANNYAGAGQLASRLALSMPSAAVLSEFELAVGNRRQALLDEAVAEANAGRPRVAGERLAAARALPGDAAASIRQTQQRLTDIAAEQRQAAQAAATERAAREAEAAAAAAAAAEREEATEAPETAAVIVAAADDTPAPAASVEAADEAIAASIRAKVTSGDLDGEAGALAELGTALETYPDSDAVAASRTLLLSAVEAKVQRQLADDDIRAAAGSIASIEDLPGADRVAGELATELAAAEIRVVGATVLPASELELVSAVPPVYPRNAMRREQEGWVEVEFTVTTEGRTADIAVVDSDSRDVFNRATIRSVSQWEFKPRLYRGEPIDQRVSTRVIFRLD